MGGNHVPDDLTAIDLLPFYNALNIAPRYHYNY